MRRYNSFRSISTGTLKWLFLGFFFLYTLLPFLWLILSSFKTNYEFTTAPFSFPETWQFENYVKAIRISGLPRLFVNSLIVSVGSTALNLFVSSLGAFVFARERFRFQNLLLNIIIAGVLIPIIGLMVPYFKIITTLRLYDTKLGLIVTYAAINLPISVFLLYGFMKRIPRELEEAAVIDGCSFRQRYSRVIIPLSRMGLVTAGIFVFLYSWNDFIYALLLTSSVKARTLQLGIRFFVSQFFTDYTAMFAAIVITILPSIIIYIIFHDKIIHGLTSGSVKE
ncbi:MAG: carbohydrate ABC transporter permease [Spirochaetales bacterium]|nr:carbohydrate ABC transporter permease [Spirochaetales bacterium]